MLECGNQREDAFNEEKLKEDPRRIVSGAGNIFGYPPYFADKRRG